MDTSGPGIWSALVAKAQMLGFPNRPRTKKTVGMGVLSVHPDFHPRPREQTWVVISSHFSCDIYYLKL